MLVYCIVCTETAKHFVGSACVMTCIIIETLIAFVTYLFTL